MSRASKLKKIVLATGALVLLAPAAAQAHPTVYTTNGHLNSGKTNEVWTLTAAGAGSYKPSADAAVIPFDAPSQVVGWALGKDPAIGVDAASRRPNVLVTGTAPNFTLQFQGALGKTNVADSVVSPTAGSAVKVRDGGTSVSYPTAIPADQTFARYVVASDGYAASLTEGNGLTTNGWLDLAQNPGTYRASETPAQWLGLGDTGAQTHASCWAVDPTTTGGGKLTTLNASANVLLVQNWAKEHPGDPVQPFWNYVPWQSTGSGFGDTPDQWIPVVASVTGADLTGLSTTAAAQACEDLGGAYVPSDVVSASHLEQAYTADQVSAAVAPLNAQIADRDAEIAAKNAQLTEKTAQIATLSTKVTDLQRQLAAAGSGRPLQLTVAAAKARAGSATAMTTGAPGAPVTLTLVVSKATAKKLKLSSTTIGTRTLRLSAQGAGLGTIKLSPAAARGFAKYKGSIPVTYRAVSGATAISVAATLLH